MSGNATGNKMRWLKGNHFMFRCHCCSTMLAEQDRRCHRCGRYLGKPPVSVYLLDVFLEAVPAVACACLLLFLVFWTLMAMSMVTGAASLGLG